jgi:hypothetical protein
VKSRCLQIAAASCWFLALATGGWWVVRYGTTASPSMPVSSFWPASTPLSRNPGRLTILVALHPKCPCTPPTLAAIAELVTRRPGAADIIVLASVPADAESDWTTSANCQAARAITGATVIEDPESRIARLHGMLTSGHIAAYDTKGHLYFSGGLTPARGQAAESASVIALLGAPHHGTDSAPVFGCRLVGAECAEHDP